VKATHITYRSYRLGEGRVVTLGIPCDADGCIVMGPRALDRLSRYLDLLAQEMAIAREARADTAPDEWPDDEAAPAAPTKEQG
jgi:hypothetical protein